MLEIKQLVEDARMLVEIKAQMERMYIDANKLKKQGQAMSNHPNVFICSHVFKEYLCTYIRTFDGVVEELQFDELNNLVNPNIYINGVIVMSKNGQTFRLDSESSSQNNSIGPLNSTEVEDMNCSNEMYLNDSISVTDSNIIYCGNCEFFAKDVNAGGARAYHGTLGQIRKVNMSLNDLIPISSVNCRYLSSAYIQSLKYQNIQAAPAFIVCCKPRKPMNISNSVLFPECTVAGETLLHILTLFEDGNRKISKMASEEGSGVSTYLSTFDMFKTANDIMVDGETSLKIEFHWEGKDYTSSQAPPSAKSVIELQVTVGEVRSAANEVYLELKRLHAITQAQINSTAQFFNSDYSQQVLDDLKKFKACVSDIQFYEHVDEASKKSSSVGNTDDAEAPLSELIKDSFWHKDIDFTDKLWTFLQEVDRFDSIYFILDDILTDIINGSLQPAISPSNETKLAKYIRKLYVISGGEGKTDTEEKIMELISSDQAVINLVREIGFEKLRKDYFHFFLSRELASISDLEKICKSSCVNVPSLWKLHYCLEIVITPAIYLKLTPDYQSYLLKAAIDYYSVNDVDIMSPKFRLSLLPFHEAASSIHSLCEDRRPVMWQHGVVTCNKAGLDEAVISHMETKSVVDVGDTDVFHLTELKLFLREETLVLPNMKSPISNGH